MRILTYQKLSSRNLELLLRRTQIASEIVRAAEGIVDKVKEEGVNAVLEFTEKFDSVKINENELLVSEKEVEEAYLRCEKEDLEVIRFARKRIEEFNKAQKESIKDTTISTGDGLAEFKWLPIKRVGIYVPAGRAPLVSSVLMAAIPAKIAGADEVVLCTPPNKDGSVNSLIIVAAKESGIDKIYKIGGAQAIATMAYGIEGLEPVQLIVGPGNLYVTAAKQIVSARGVVKIDLPAGPSEILVIADESADSKLIASDMQAQTEHGSSSSAICITDSKGLAYAIKKEIESTSDKQCLVILVDDLSEAIEFCNEFAPEHLELYVKEPEKFIDRIENVGAIFVNTPVVFGDYGILGINHILPTGKTAKFYSGVTLFTFMKGVFLGRLSRSAQARMAKIAAKFARMEGLEKHAESAELRGKP
jgi:histidinol dehydrogenase